MDAQGANKDFQQARTDHITYLEEKFSLSQASPAEHTDQQQIPSQHDMLEVNNLSGHVARLEQELDLARLQLRDAWARVPFDSSLLKKPWKSDIAVTCRACGKPTVWRTAKGIAEHQPECPTESVRRIPTISSDVWDILRGLDTDDENLDDD